MKTFEALLVIVHEFLWGTYLSVEVKVPYIDTDKDGNQWTGHKKLRVKVKLPSGYEIRDDFLNAVYEDLAAKSLRG